MRSDRKMFVPRENPPCHPGWILKRVGRGKENKTGAICSGLIVAGQAIDLLAEKNHTLFLWPGVESTVFQQCLVCTHTNAHARTQFRIDASHSKHINHFVNKHKQA